MVYMRLFRCAASLDPRLRGDDMQRNLSPILLTITRMTELRKFHCAFFPTYILSYLHTYKLLHNICLVVELKCFGLLMIPDGLLDHVGDLLGEGDTARLPEIECH